MNKTEIRIKKRNIKNLKGLFSDFENRMLFRNYERNVINNKPKKDGRLVWDSSLKGTYVKAIHGDLV